MKLMKRIVSVLLCAAVLFGCFAMLAVAEEQTVEEQVTEMLAKEREPGQVVVNFRDGVTRAEADQMLVETGVLTDPTDPKVVLRDNWDFLSQDVPLSYTLYVGESRIFDVLVTLLQNELVQNACPNYVVHLVDNGEIFFRGDVNTDGEVDMADYLLLKRTMLGTYKPTEIGEFCADANGDGTVDSLDYLLVKRHILGTFGDLGTVYAHDW